MQLTKEEQIIIEDGTKALVYLFCDIMEEISNDKVDQCIFNIIKDKIEKDIG